MQILRPCHPRRRLLARVIVTKAIQLNGLKLGPAARVEVFVGLLEQAVKVLDHPLHLAAVDVVEFLRVGPFAFVVVDFELEVWWDPVFC